MKKFLIAGLATIALVACGKEEEAPQAPAPSPQSEQMKGNDMAPMEDMQPQSEYPAPEEEDSQTTEPQSGYPAEEQDQGMEEPMAMPQQAPDDLNKE